MLHRLMILIFAASTILSAQDALDRYIQQTLDSNLALQQADFSYQKSIAVLREARGLKAKVGRLYGKVRFDPLTASNAIIITTENKGFYILPKMIMVHKIDKSETCK